VQAKFTGVRRREERGMPLMEWSENLSVGIEQFDSEHKTLVGIVNELFDAVTAHRGDRVLGSVLGRLVTYTETHFSHEERVMALHGYPMYASHREEHDKLTKQVVEIQARLERGATAALSLQVMFFLKDWLLNHVMGSDKEYGPYLRSKGVS
jgi:hemerythrin